MADVFITPKKIISGDHALEKAIVDMKALGGKALIVTDQTMVKTGNLDRLLGLLDTAQILYSVYSEINREPDDQMVLKGRQIFLQESCDCLIALGGGSPIDAMKAIALLTKSSRQLSEYMGNVIDAVLPPMIAIPTTAGTGSEVTQFTIITDCKSSVKMLLKGPSLMPDLAVVDSGFTITVPPMVTAATGLDALCHAVEAYTSKKAQPLSDTFALSSVKRIFQYLPEAYKHGESKTAREQMSLAALEAGIAFNNSSVTLIHGMSRPIGALFHVAHGISNAVLMNVCLKFALDGAIERFAVLGRTVGTASEADADQAAAEKFIEALLDLTRNLCVPTLKELGIDRGAFCSVIEKMAEDAMISTSPQNTRKTVTKEDVISLYNMLWQER